MGNAPTGKKLELPPQAFSMIFNEQGQVKAFNVGYVMDRTVGNTGVSDFHLPTHSLHEPCLCSL